MGNYDMLCVQQETSILPSGDCSYGGNIWSFCFPSSFIGECGWPYDASVSMLEYWNYGHPSRPQVMANFKKIYDKAASLTNGQVVSWNFDCDSTITLHIQYEDLSSNSIKLNNSDSDDICKSLLQSAYQMSDSANGFTRNCEVFISCRFLEDVFECNLHAN